MTAQACVVPTEDSWSQRGVGCEENHLVTPGGHYAMGAGFRGVPVVNLSEDLALLISAIDLLASYS